MKQQMARVASRALSRIAKWIVTPACAGLLHRPEVPMELLKK